MQRMDELFTNCHGTQALKMYFMRTGWDSLETMYKVRLTEFVFKRMTGFTVTEFKDLFVQRNSGRRRNKDIILPRPETNFIRNSIDYRGAIGHFLCLCLKTSLSAKPFI